MQPLREYDEQLADYFWQYVRLQFGIIHDHEIPTQLRTKQVLGVTLFGMILLFGALAKEGIEEIGVKAPAAA